MMKPDHRCDVCGDIYFYEHEADVCCLCRFCGEPTEYSSGCDECYSERNCEGCYMVYEGEDPEEGMVYGCSSENSVGVPCEEDTLCFDCWTDRQPPLIQLAGALL
jgi:hypothetical protein